MAGALDHVKVLDFSWVIAAPLATKVLAEHGATVVRVESATRPDLARSNLPNVGEPGINRCAFFAAYNNDKYGMTVDLAHPRAREVIEPLVEWADVIVENFRAGTLEKLGFTREELQRINPGVTIIRATLFGQTGPYRHVAGFGGTMMALTGFTGLIGWPDRAPAGSPVPYPDFLAPWWVVSLAIAGLAQRRATGRGGYYDLSQAEASVHALEPWVLEQSVRGAVTTAMGNRSADAAPHGVFPCAGEDRWCAIAARDDDEWDHLAMIVGGHDLAQDVRFTDLEGRKAHEDALEAIIGGWTATQPPQEVMRRLQDAGIPAGIVLDGEGLHADEQLRLRGHFVRLKHPEMGLRTYDAPAFRLSRDPAELTQAAPCLGQHTEMICREILGMGDDEFVGLLADGVFD